MPPIQPNMRLQPEQPLPSPVEQPPENQPTPMADSAAALEAKLQAIVSIIGTDALPFKLELKTLTVPRMISLLEGLQSQLGDLVAKLRANEARLTEALELSKARE